MPEGKSLCLHIAMAITCEMNTPGSNVLREGKKWKLSCILGLNVASTGVWCHNNNTNCEHARVVSQQHWKTETAEVNIEETSVVELPYLSFKKG